MKPKILAAFLFAASIFATVVGCKKSEPEQPVYSCDPVLNVWAGDLRESRPDMTRAEISAFCTIDSQMAAYNALTASAKAAVWNEKLHLVKSTYGLTSTEQNHVQTLISNVSATVFTDSNSLNQFATWADSWVLFAKTTLNWSDAKVWDIAETWMVTEELERMHHYYVGGGSGSSGPSPGSKPCTCRSAFGCEWFVQECVGGKKNTCDKARGCGILGSANCTGNCFATGTL